MIRLDETNREALCEGLETLETSRGFLLLLLASVMLSYYVLTIQRDGVCLTLKGDAQAAAALPDVFPLRAGGSALVVGALGYFFVLTLRTCAQAKDPVAIHSANMNVIAGFLVLLAALIRLYDLNFVQRNQPALTEDLLPD